MRERLCMLGTQESLQLGVLPGSRGKSASLNIPVPPEDTCWQLLHTDEGRNNGPSLCVHHPDTISEPVHHDYWEKNNPDRISHPSSDTGGTEMPAHKQPLSPRPTLLAPRSAGFASNWQTLDLHECFVLRVHRPLETD